MTHQVIQLKDLSLSFKNRLCFDDFNTQVLPGSRIGIIGRNGSGKSSLLKVMAKELEPSSGEVIIDSGTSISFVKQIIEDNQHLSGGQRFNQALSEALAQYPDVLLLDEPTNHLDRKNKKSLLRMLKHYSGTLIVVSHDKALLNSCVDSLWHCDNQKITEFSGSYENYLRQMDLAVEQTERELTELKRSEKNLHQQKMREEQRAAKSRRKGEKSIKNRKWPTIVSDAKARRSQETAGKKQRVMNLRREALADKLDSLYIAEVIIPSFSLSAEINKSSTIVLVDDGSIGYREEKPLITQIKLSIVGTQKIAITGDNGSGKSTLLKALLNNPAVIKSGEWQQPSKDNIGYLCQHYSNLEASQTVLAHLTNLRPDWSEKEIRSHLNTFLFRKNEEVQKLVGILSGGEKARLSLAVIAAKPPRLLILDEMTNNLDLETKTHVEQVLKHYPGAMIVVSHDDDFVETLGVDATYEIKEGQLFLVRMA